MRKATSWTAESSTTAKPTYPQRPKAVPSAWDQTPMAQQPVSTVATRIAAETVPGTADQTISADQRGSVIVGLQDEDLRRETMTTAIEGRPGVVLVVAAEAGLEDQM